MSAACEERRMWFTLFEPKSKIIRLHETQKLLSVESMGIPLA